MWFQPYYRTATGCASYLLADEILGEAMVVDPLADLGSDFYAAEAADRGLRITHVVDTHLHADHVSCGQELATLTGARYDLHEASPVSFPFHPLADGEEIRIGSLRVTVRHAPGHTPEDVVLLVSDLSRSPEPWMAFTGDTLFVGDVGRPDLLAVAGRDPRQSAYALYETLHRVILPLPDDVEVYPAHFGASACGGHLMSGKPMSTIGFERRYNLALQQKDPETFARLVLSGLKPPPDNAFGIRTSNIQVHDAPAYRVGGPSLEEILAHPETYAVVDLRPHMVFLAGHLPESRNVPFAQRGLAADVRSRLKQDASKSLVLVAENPVVLDLASSQLSVDGLRIAGTLLAQPEEWARSGYPVRSIDRLTTDEFRARVAAPGDAILVDVRLPEDRIQGVVEGTRLIPIDRLEDALEELDPQASYMVFCRVGRKASAAAALMSERGFRNLHWVQGGMVEWMERGYPVVEDPERVLR